jgi:hypothetical protein
MGILADMLSKESQLGGKRPRTVKRKTMKNIKNMKNITGTRGQGTFVRGWSKKSPGTHERTIMLERCGKKCFLGPKKSFPICTRGTCKRNKKGVYAAFLRAREYTTIKGSEKYRRIARTAKRMLRH